MRSGYVGLEYVRCRPMRGRKPWGVFSFPSFSTGGSETEAAGPASLFRDAVSEVAVLVAGSGAGRVPVTISASQSPRPPGTASTAV